VDVFGFWFQIVHTRSGGVGGRLHILPVGQINEWVNLAKPISLVSHRMSLHLICCISTIACDELKGDYVKRQIWKCIDMELSRQNCHPKWLPMMKLWNLKLHS
jgi:hypothetical protein